jgi:hypothetical protein
VFIGGFCDHNNNNNGETLPPKKAVLVISNIRSSIHHHSTRLAAHAGDHHFVIRPGRASLFRKLVLQLFHLWATIGTIVVANTAQHPPLCGPERLDQADERPRVARVQL